MTSAKEPGLPAGGDHVQRLCERRLAVVDGDHRDRIGRDADSRRHSRASIQAKSSIAGTNVDSIEVLERYPASRSPGLA